MSKSNKRHFYSQLSRMQRLYAKALSRRLDPYGVKPGYLDILDRLWSKDNLTQKQLHRRLDIEQATLSNSLKRMERDGILLRKRTPQDKRVMHIVLTDHGRALQKVVNTAINDLQSVVNMGLTINDRRYFHRILKQMTEQAEEDLADTALVLVDEIAD